MKIISPLLFVPIIFVSCNLKAQRMAPPLNLPAETVFLKINPESFIQELPNELNETSGLIYYDGLLWSFNDSGGRNAIYGFDFSGIIKKKVIIENADNYDWESITQDKKHIYIGDFGNNSGNRKNLKIYKITKTDLTKKKGEIKAQEIKFRYPDQSGFKSGMNETAFDCEAMFEFDEYIYLFSKNWEKQITTLYKIPKESGEYVAELQETFNVNGLVTGADISPDNKNLALVGYRDYVPFVWFFSEFEKDHFFTGEKTFVLMDSIIDAQTEGICFLNDNILLISCEATSSFTQQIFMFNTLTMSTYGTHQGESDH